MFVFQKINILSHKIQFQKKVRTFSSGMTLGSHSLRTRPQGFIISASCYHSRKDTPPQRNKKLTVKKEENIIYVLNDNQMCFLILLTA